MSLTARIIAGIEAIIGNGSRRRHGPDHEPVLITNRRIYILPTRLGLMYAAAIFAMALGGMNYGNNLALALAFILGALGLVAMHHCHRNLAGLQIHSVASEPVFAGQLAHVQLAFNNASPQTRLAIQAAGNQQSASPIYIAANTESQASLPQATLHRGWHKIERLIISTRYPFGLFRAWSVLQLNLQYLVYPRPSDRRTTPPAAKLAADNLQQLQQGEDEFAGLRGFHAGDSPKRIAWKAYAREQGLLVKQYADTSVSAYVLDWDTLAGLDTETRLSHLCRWIMDAHQAGIAYGLKMPGLTTPPQLSETHRQHCLKALAVFRQ